MQQAILTHLIEKEYAPNHPYLILLAQKLTEKSIEFNQESNQLKTLSILQWELDDPAKRDVLIKIGRLTPSFSIFSELTSQDSFQKLFQKLSPTVIEELNHCFMETHKTSLIQQMEMPDDMALRCDMTDTADIDENWYQVQNEEFEERQTMAVKVRVHDLSWFYEDSRNYVYFSTLIEGMPDKVYSTELI